MGKDRSTTRAERRESPRPTISFATTHQDTIWPLKQDSGKELSRTGLDNFATSLVFPLVNACQSFESHVFLDGRPEVVGNQSMRGMSTC